MLKKTARRVKCGNFERNFARRNAALRNALPFLSYKCLCYTKAETQNLQKEDYDLIIYFKINVVIR